MARGMLRFLVRPTSHVVSAALVWGIVAIAGLGALAATTGVASAVTPRLSASHYDDVTPSASTTRAITMRTDVLRARLGPQTSPGDVRLVSGYRLAANTARAARCLFGPRRNAER